MASRSNRLIFAYSAVLTVALGMWTTMAVLNVAPPYTWTFFIYIFLNVIAEFYLLIFRDKWKMMYIPVKYGQSVSLIVLVFTLANGDLGKAIVIELIYIIGRGAWTGIQSSITTPWNRINRINEEITIFILITVAVVIWENDPSFLCNSRTLLLMGFGARAWLSVYRVKRGMMPGCRLDQWAAIGLAIWWIAVAYISVI